MQTKIIVTLGPSTRTQKDLEKIKDKGVDFVRINMSHSSIDDLEYFIALAKKVGIPFIIDTEGSQVRTGDLEKTKIAFKEGDEVKIYGNLTIGNENKIFLRPRYIIDQLEEGDILHVDFDTLILRISDTSTRADGYIIARAISAGVLGKNKAVVVDPGIERALNLSPLTDKDYESIRIGLREGTEHIAASFMRSGVFVDEIRKATKGKMRIISKIECIEALEHLDEIIEKSDSLLLDRGDLGKEIPIEKVPWLQKVIIKKAEKKNKDVIVATNLLESMIENKKPTRAEISDVVNTMCDGAGGLVLSAETAIGKYPMKCINMLNILIREAKQAKNAKVIDASENPIIEKTETGSSFFHISSSALIPPHGGILVDQMIKKIPDSSYIKSLQKIKLNENLQMDVEQIAIGAFSPIAGFMTEKDFISVLDNTRLSSGVVWPIPIILDVSEEKGNGIKIGDTVALIDDNNEALALLHIEDKYYFDKKQTAKKLYGTNDLKHPGVKWIIDMQPILLGGQISLLKRRESNNREYNLTPRQTRLLFQERMWSKVVGFHTRNVIHKSHEYVQMEAMNKVYADGLFVHPVVGKKKKGDFCADPIIKSYELMMERFYPKDSVVLATFSTFSRYAGPREALFTALCRKNFGCSHFVVGRDHTGVGDFYPAKASHEIFDQFPSEDIGIIPIRFDKVFYSKKLGNYIHEGEDTAHKEEDKLHISGTEVRKILEKRETPPKWFMRPEISKLLLDMIKKGDEVFVK